MLLTSPDIHGGAFSVAFNVEKFHSICATVRSAAVPPNTDADGQFSRLCCVVLSIVTRLHRSIYDRDVSFALFRFVLCRSFLVIFTLSAIKP